MVKTGGPRGHGSGTAKSPEAEAARREKIRQSNARRKTQIRVLIVADYRKAGRPEGAHRSRLAGWTYQTGRVYSTRISPGIATNRYKLAEHLDNLHPARKHFSAKVIEYL